MAARPDFIVLADVIIGSSPSNIGDGTGTVPVVGDEIRVPELEETLTVYRRVLDAATATWHVHVRRTRR